MSPIAQFEASARTVWRSKLSPADKSKRLHDVRSAIGKYVARLDERRKSAGLDPWVERSFDRVRSYLVHLASDVESLSLECERSAGAKPPGAMTAPYVA